MPPELRRMRGKNEEVPPHDLAIERVRDWVHKKNMNLRSLTEFKLGTLFAMDSGEDQGFLKRPTAKQMEEAEKGSKKAKEV